MATIETTTNAQIDHLNFTFWKDYESVTPPWVVAEDALFTEETTASSNIRCPLCQWQPGPSDRWMCADCAHPEYFFAGCGTVWNTFTTQGRCPGCAHQWRYTRCLRCMGWSLHQDWYGGE